MKVNKIQADSVKQKNANNCKHITTPQILVSHTQFPKGIDAKSIVNINFRGSRELLSNAKNWTPDYDKLKKELDGGTDINAIDEESDKKYTPLIWLVGGEKCEAKFKCIEYVLSRDDLDINANNNPSKHTALIRACILLSDMGKSGERERGLKKTLELLLSQPDIDLTIKDASGKTASDYVYKYGNSDIIQMFESYTKEGRIFKKQIPVNINNLSPEENIWTSEEISKRFLQFVKAKKYEDAGKMLQNTPMINLDGDNNTILSEVCKTGDLKFIKKVFNYLFNMQAQMQEEYDSRRKEFMEKTIKTLGYDGLKNSNVALNTTEGFRMLMDNPEFNPNDTVEDSSLFERACKLDPDGNLAKEILAKYGDVITAKAAKTRNKIIKDLINDYEKVGKFRIVLNKIEDNAFYADERRSIAANQLKELLESKDFTPEIADEVGNSVLHIAAALPDDMGRTLIQMALDKGIDINAENCTGQRPLMSAIKKLVTTDDNAGKMNLMSNIKFLLDKGVDINAQDNNGQTAFHFACMSTVAALLTLLLSKNPNVFLLDKKGERAAKYLKTPEMKEIYNKYLGAV